MTALAINLLALLIVLGLCWAAMMWISGRFQAHGDATAVEGDVIGDLSTPTASEAPCIACGGVGAQNAGHKLALCPACYGTGVLS
ncbi:MAG: hypothetical protein ACKVIQ_03845 [Acidimicrobiales bacterium]